MRSSGCAFDRKRHDASSHDRFDHMRQLRRGTAILAGSVRYIVGEEDNPPIRRVCFVQHPGNPAIVERLFQAYGLELRDIDPSVVHPGMYAAAVRESTAKQLLC